MGTCTPRAWGSIDGLGLGELGVRGREAREPGGGAVAAVVVLVVVALLASYNRFVRDAQLIDNSWSNVDTELRRRYDLVPNLVETVKATPPTSARPSRPSPRPAPRPCARGRRRLPVGRRERSSTRRGACSRSPRPTRTCWRAGTSAELQDELVTTENCIQAARRIFNGNVRDYNTRVQSVPSNLVARLCGFRESAPTSRSSLPSATPAPLSVRMGRPAGAWTPASTPPPRTSSRNVVPPSVSAGRNGQAAPRGGGRPT